MRVIRHPMIVDSARDWLRRTDVYAREQERAVERAKAAQPIDKLLVDDLRFFVARIRGCVEWVRLAVPPLALPVDEGEHPPSLRRIALLRLGVAHAASLAAHEVLRRHYLRVIEACDGSTGAAADLLGVDRRTLQRFLAERRR